jgi:SAM-dependent methyltransferase
VSRQPWTRYYDAAGEEPRDTLLRALELFGSEQGHAVDLGCGTGRDTAELLRRGWSVLAVDAEEEAITRLRAKLGEPEGLSTQVSRFEDFRFPDAHLVNSSFAFPFCPPAAFPLIWKRMASSLVPGGRFAGHLFGDRDDWARTGGSPTKGEITFHTRGEVDDLVRPFEVELLDEFEEDHPTATGEDKHWHAFRLVLRKP